MKNTIMAYSKQPYRVSSHNSGFSRHMQTFFRRHSQGQGATLEKVVLSLGQCTLECHFDYEIVQNIGGDAHGRR